MTDRGGRDGLRVLVVNWLDRENPQAGGAETHLHEIFGRLARRGHEVTLLCSGWDGCDPRAHLDGIDVHRAGGRYTFSIAGPRYFRRHLADARFDVVVEDLNKVPVFTPLWCRSKVLLLVHHLFGRTAFQEASLPLALGTWILERPIGVVFSRTPTIAVSESTKQDLVRRGLGADRIEVIPNGIEVELYTPDPEGRRRPRPTVLYLGRVKKYKGIDLVLEAIPRLVEEGIDLEFLIAGTGDHLPALKSKARRLGIEDSVRFLGWVEDEQKLELFRTAWLHVLTSPKEGWGIANIEAGACGTPTVASDSPGLRESVVPGETGLLVPHGDVTALADAIGSLLREPSIREGMGLRARAFAKRFSWDASTDAVERSLRRVVAGSRPG